MTSLYQGVGLLFPGLVSAAQMSRGIGPAQEAAVKPQAVRLVSPPAVAFPASFPIQEQAEPRIKPSSTVRPPITSQEVKGQRALEIPEVCFGFLDNHS